MRKLLIACAVFGLIVSGCGGGSSSTGSSSSVSGFVLPTEISAVPADNTASPSGVVTGFVSGIQALASGVAVTDFSTTSDYTKTNTKKYVEERALEQFSIIEQVINALSQTNYADAENIGADPYTAMIAWVEERDGREQKTLEPWVVQSSMIVENGRDVNRAIAWIEEPDYDIPGEVRVIRAEFKIYTSASVNADGSYADYGEWDLNVNFDGSLNPASYFAASSTIANGVNTIKIHEKGLGEGGPGAEMKGVLVRSGTSGYGKVKYPEYDFCWQPGAPNPCTPPLKTAQYAYNTDYLAVDPDITTVDPVYKDRNRANAVEMTHRYGLFYADADTGAGIAAGDSVERHKSFGFPVSFSDSGNNNLSTHAYYGAWQGRHSLWVNQNATLNAGDVVTRDDFGGSGSATQYTVSAKFAGTLTKRTLVAGDLNDIKGIPVETFINKHYDLNYNGTNWEYCDGWMDWSVDNFPSPTTPADRCKNFDNSAGTITNFTPNLGSLVVVAGDRKHVNIGRWTGSANQDYVYLATDPSTVTWTGAGFYPATRDQNTGQLSPVAASSAYAPAPNDAMYVDIGGSIYIQYTGDFINNGGTGWVQKTLLSWDARNYRPEFDPSGDSPFSPGRDGEYYIQNNGANFVVKRIGNLDEVASYETKIELQTAANPVNIASILPANTSYLSAPWRPEVKYSLVTTPTTDPNFMKLVYVTDDPNTGDVDESLVTTVLTSGVWGLQAHNVTDEPLKADGTAVTVDQFGFPTDPSVRPVEFNWEYSAEGWGSQQFLVDGSGDYVMLSDPIALNPISVTNGAGDTKTLSLQFDGWMHGLPDMYNELSKNDFQMTAELSNKVVNIAAGTAVVDNNAVNYYLKPLDVSIFLNVQGSAPAGAPDFTAADAIDLDLAGTVPIYVDNGMGAKPTGTTVKYSEGKPLS